MGFGPDPFGGPMGGPMEVLVILLVVQWVVQWVLVLKMRWEPMETYFFDDPSLYMTTTMNFLK